MEENISKNMYFFVQNFHLLIYFPEHQRPGYVKKLFSPSDLYGHDTQSLIMRKDQKLRIPYFEEKYGVKHLHKGMMRKVHSNNITQD